MMAEHGDVCTGQEVSFCMNGGTCYKLPNMNQISCVCRHLYTGSRCETLSLFSALSQDEYNKGLIAAIVIVTLLIALAVAVFIFYIIKKLRERKKQQQDNDQKGPYWKVQSRA